MKKIRTAVSRIEKITSEKKNAAIKSRKAITTASARANGEDAPT
jgi:hypothetical protein